MNRINDMLEKYDIKNAKDELNAMKEIIQEIVLVGLWKGGFFDQAAFYGGTALRIFYNLDRFSEDLDFALLSPNPDFSLQKFFPYIENAVNSYGLNLKVETKNKSVDSNISSAFLKGDTLENILVFFPNENFQDKTKILKSLKIKFEIDTNPPAGAITTRKYKLLPETHEVQIYDAPSLFAGKIHAILCRNWSTRTKGRDLYDYIFFLSKNVNVNLDLLKSKLVASNVLQENDDFVIEKAKTLLKRKFAEIDYDSAKEDVKPFIKDSTALNTWSKEFFISITDNLS